MLVAALADAEWSEGRIRFSLKRNRKKERLERLLENYGIAYWENKDKENYKRYVFYAPKNWYRTERRWGSWVLELDMEEAHAMLDELGHWDGWKRNKSTVFCTSRKYEAEWVQTLACTNGKGQLSQSMSKVRQVGQIL